MYSMVILSVWLIAFFTFLPQTVLGEVYPLWDNRTRCGTSKASKKSGDKSDAFSSNLFQQNGLVLPYVQDRMNRVVGGIEAQPNSWPWMGAMIRGNYYICGAVLIDPRIVLTAAHCVIEQLDPSYYRIILGSHSLYDGKAYKVRRITSHPSFNRGFPPRAHDVALLQLETAAELSSKVEVVCSPTFNVGGNRECVVTGWGRLYEDGPPAAKLQQVSVPVLDNGVCNDWRHYGGLIHSTMLCAGWEEGGKDTCQGDSGGPLVCNENGVWQLHGLVSWGYGCARAHKPGVYSRVWTLKDWITTQANILNSS